MTLEFEQSRWPRYDFVAGVDEVGRGPLAGPVVAAAVMFEKGFTVPPSLAGINDSKQLDAAARETFAAEVFKFALSVGIGAIDEAVIDRVNILQATFLAMQRAIENLSAAPQFLFIDGNRFLKPYPLAYQTVVKGDAKVFSIAAASIVAKVHRDKLMQGFGERYPHYNFHSNMGYPTPDHIAAIRLHGRCAIHRKTFRLSALGEK
ncbi:MAG: ribonuclease HII [Rhizobacter sp.]|nr:ribonuclease HII [Chlorobiales bacterium]